MPHRRWGVSWGRRWRWRGAGSPHCRRRPPHPQAHSPPVLSTAGGNSQSHPDVKIYKNIYANLWKFRASSAGVKLLRTQGPLRSSFPDSVIERGIRAIKTKTERGMGRHYNGIQPARNINFCPVIPRCPNANITMYANLHCFQAQYLYYGLNEEL